MRVLRIFLSFLLLFSISVPAEADFTYSEKSTITGGALLGIAKFASVFSKQSAQALKPTVTTRYVKGNRLRLDQADGKIQIIDLDARQITEIDTQTKTYGSVTFDELKAFFEQQQQAIQQASQQAAAQRAAANPTPATQPNQPQVTFTPKVEILPGTGAPRVILGQNTTEQKVRVDLEMTAQNPPPNQGGQSATATPASTTAQPNGAGAQQGSLTTSLITDSWVASSVGGYAEFADFYKRMAKEVDWTPSANMNLDPRMKQGMAELQKNSAALKGLPMLSFFSMRFVPPPGSQQDQSSATAQQNSQQQQQPANTSKTSSDDTIPTNASAAVMKGLGGFFKKKQQQKQEQQDQTNSTNGNSSQASSATAPPPGAVGPNDLMDLTVEVTSFSSSTLDGSLFEIPAGFTRIQETPAQVLGGAKTNPK